MEIPPSDDLDQVGNFQSQIGNVLFDPTRHLKESNLPTTCRKSHPPTTVFLAMCIMGLERRIRNSVRSVGKELRAAVMDSSR